MRTSYRLLIVVCALLLGTLSRAVWATTYTWQAGGGTIDWGDAGNWAGGTAPVSSLLTTDVLFGNAGTRVSSRIAPNFSIRALTFTSDASIYTFSGGPLRIGAGGITHDAFNEQTFSTAQVVLGANQTWTLGSNAGALRLSANVDMAGRTLTINAARTTGSGNIIDGNFLGVGALIKTGAGILSLSATGSTYTGGTTINEGVLAFSDGGAFGTGNVNLAGGELRATVNTTLERIVSVASGMTGTIAAATGTTLTLNALSVLGDLTLGSAGNAGTIMMNLSTYAGSSDAGTVSINAGTVRLGGPRFGGMTQHLARTTIGAGATFDLNNISAAINNLQGAGALVMNDSGAGSGDAPDGSSTTLTLYSGDFAGTISGYGNLVKDSPGTLVLSGVNTFTQGTTLKAGALGVGNNAALGSGFVRVSGAAALFAHGGERALAQEVHLDLDAVLTIGAQPGQTHRLTLAGPIEGPGGLVKSGAGTLALMNYNSFSGGFTLNGGTVEALNEASLGAPENVLTFNAGRLEFIGDTTLTRTYNLSNATTIAAAPGRTITYLSGSAVNGGNLGAGGTHEFASGFTLNGSTAAVGSRLTTNGNVTFANATLRGAVTQNNGTLAMTNTIVSSAGSLTVNGTVAMDGVESGGVIHVNAGGKVSSTGAALVLASGSRTTIEAGGALVAAPGASIELNGGILRNNGTQTGTLNVNFGSLALGSGSFGNVRVNEGGRFSAGAGTGAVSLTALTLGSGGRYTFELGSTAANTELAGGFLNIAGQLQIDAGNTADSRFTIAIVSPSTLAFDPTQAWTFTLATASGGITGFSAEQFAIDSSGFGIPTNGGSFSVSQNGNDLLMRFAPVPEPSTWAMMLAGTGLLVMFRRWRR